MFRPPLKAASDMDRLTLSGEKWGRIEGKWGIKVISGLEPGRRELAISSH